MTTTAPSVLVIGDGGATYVLAAARAWGRAGVRVGSASPEPDPLLVRSRYHCSWHPLRLPEQDLDGFADDIRHAARAGRYDLICPSDDIELLALSMLREVLPPLVPLPAHEALLRAVDKLTLGEAARSVGLGTPTTWAATPDAVAAVTSPVVVKARLHWSPGAPSGADRHHEALLCQDASAVSGQVARLAADGALALLQEPVSGEQIALSVVVDRTGALVAVCQQRTTRASLRRTSCRAETTPVDADLLDGSVRLLRELAWVGLANLQFLVAPGGPPLLIDLNGRLYGSLALAVGAGCDLPGALLALQGPPRTARPGVRFQALHADLLRARSERRGGLARDVADTGRAAWGAVHSTWSLTDPLPAAALLGDVAGRGLRLGGRARG